MADGRLAKHVQYLQRHIAAQSDGQAKVTEVDDNLEFVKLDVLPKDGLYKGAKLRFKIGFSESYPYEVPQVLCLDYVYHPNIDPLDNADSLDLEYGSNVCVSLFDDWDSDMGLDHIVMAILFLMYNPNLEDPLSPFFDSHLTMEDIEEKVGRTLRGETVDEQSWPRLMVEDEKEGQNEVKSNQNDSVAGADKLDGEDCGVPTTCTTEETTEKSGSVVNSLETVSPSLSDSGTAAGSKEADTQNLPLPTSASNDSSISRPWTLDFETVMLNLHNCAVTDGTSEAIRLSPGVICLDSAGRDCKNSDTKCCGHGLGIFRFFSCSSRIKTLFSNFHRQDVTLQVQATRALDDSGDCDVD